MIKQRYFLTALVVVSLLGATSFAACPETYDVSGCVNSCLSTTPSPVCYNTCLSNAKIAAQNNMVCPFTAIEQAAKSAGSGGGNGDGFIGETSPLQAPPPASPPPPSEQPASGNGGIRY